MNTKLNSMNSINLNSHATNKLIMLKQYFFFLQCSSEEKNTMIKYIYFHRYTIQDHKIWLNLRDVYTVYMRT